MLIASACCGYQMLVGPEFWRCDAERICKHRCGHVLTEVKVEEDVQIKHLYDKHMILIFVLIMVWSGSKDLQRTRALAMLCLTIGDRTLIYSLKSRKLGSSGYHLCRDTYIYEDKNTQKLIQKKKSKMSKEPFLKSHFQLSHWQFMQKSFSLLLRRLINNKI